MSLHSSMQERLWQCVTYIYSRTKYTTHVYNKYYSSSKGIHAYGVFLGCSEVFRVPLIQQGIVIMDLLHLLLNCSNVTDCLDHVATFEIVFFTLDKSRDTELKCFISYNAFEEQWESNSAPGWRSGLRHRISVLKVSLQTLV